MRMDVESLPQVVANTQQVIILQPHSHLTWAEHAARVCMVWAKQSNIIMSVKNNNSLPFATDKLILDPF